MSRQAVEGALAGRGRFPLTATPLNLPMTRTLHPDTGGDNEITRQLNAAYREIAQPHRPYARERNGFAPHYASGLRIQHYEVLTEASPDGFCVISA
jgi:hypothetical protein